MIQKKSDELSLLIIHAQELIDNFNICWSANVKARILNDTQNNEYKKRRQPIIRAQFATYEYYLNKLRD